MSSVILELRQALKAQSDPVVQASGQRFFKETIALYGVKTAAVYRLGKQSLALLKTVSKAELFDLCEELWQSDWQEEALIACQWAYSRRQQFEQAEWLRFEQWIDRYINNWAKCDSFCNHTVGSWLERFPAQAHQLLEWTSRPNRWLRRAAAVSLIVPARKGLFLPLSFEIAERLLTDPEDMVQKGYGWLLKVTSQAHPTAVFDFVRQRRAIMPRTALRYAIEKMPLNLKAQAMEK